ncbi:hypothetical protein KCU64_g7872, partial [Aureobasidium melanogenum]
PGKCDATFYCNTGKWPNVCNNARSAIEKRNYQSILTYRKRDMHITKPWSNTHSNYGLRPDNLLTKSRYYNYGGPPGRKYAFTGQTKTKARPGLPAGMVNVAPAEKYSSPKAPAEGWGLIGVEITGPQKDRDDYCLEPGNDDYCHNACAIPYGADSTLVNYWKDSKNDDIRYDPWFDEKGKTFEHITKSVLGQKPEKTNLPSQYERSTDGAKEIEFSVANAAISKFCNTLLESSAIIGPGTHAPAVDPFFPDMTGKNFNGEPVFLHATWNGTGSSCEPLDFGNDSFSVSDGLEYTSGGMLLANFIEWGVRPADYASIEL